MECLYRDCLVVVCSINLINLLLFRNHVMKDIHWLHQSMWDLYSRLVLKTSMKYYSRAFSVVESSLDITARFPLRISALSFLSLSLIRFYEKVHSSHRGCSAAMSRFVRCTFCIVCSLKLKNILKVHRGCQSVIFFSFMSVSNIYIFFLVA